MATSLIASGASKLICKKPIYYALAENFMTAHHLAKKEKGKPDIFPEDPGTRA